MWVLKKSDKNRGKKSAQIRLKRLLFIPRQCWHHVATLFSLPCIKILEKELSCFFSVSFCMETLKTHKCKKQRKKTNQNQTKKSSVSLVLMFWDISILQKTWGVLIEVLFFPLSDYTSLCHSFQPCFIFELKWRKEKEIASIIASRLCLSGEGSGVRVQWVCGDRKEVKAAVCREEEWGLFNLILWRAGKRKIL